MTTKTQTAFRNHRIGSRKGDVHKVFVTKGREQALLRGRKLGLAETTVNSWTATWRQETVRAKVAASKKKVAVKKSKKVA